MGNIDQTTISFNEGDIQRATARTKYRDGYYRWRTTGARKNVNDKGNMSLVLSVGAIDADGQVRGPNNLKFFLSIPMRTPPHVLEEAGLGSDFKQKKVPNTIPMSLQFLRAVYGESKFPFFPKFDADASTKEVAKFRWNDGLISEEEKAEIVSSELIPNLLSALTDSWNDPDSLVGTEFIGTLSYQGRYTRINRPSSDLPRDPDTGVVTDSLVDLDDCFVDPTDVGVTGGEVAAI